MSIKSPGGTSAQELTQVLDKIDESQVEEFIEAISKAK